MASIIRLTYGQLAFSPAWRMSHPHSVATRPARHNAPAADPRHTSKRGNLFGSSGMGKRITDITPAELAAALPKKKQRLVVTAPSVTVGETLQLLAKHDILSLAIFSTYRPDQVVNIVNVKDLVGHILGINDRAAKAADEQPINPKATFNPQEAVARLRQNIEAVMTLDADKESYRVLEAEMTEPLGPIIEAFGHQNAHRALAIDHVNGAEPFVLSQTDVLLYVRERPEVRGCLAGRRRATELRAAGASS
ncbi:MAG: hypothetical protein BJ554DRAFT_3987 [Olpidium bornovanus]|uniref:CBS domain-containing protein n=1 Tax=Olpidium bornovanus TaxID=278681 RepID=A0A8H8DFV1_9FUNG|nr:MAG: hypothetical protein BJ554DRAFT_3987 [Olpidium bornovanus]